MRKYTIGLCLITVITATSISCTQESDFITEGKMFSLNAPPYAETAGRYLYTENGKDAIFELTENGGILKIDADKLAAKDSSVYISCQYKMLDIPADSLITQLDAIRMEESINMNELPIETHNTCRSWKPEKTYITVVLKKAAKVGEVFDGCNLGEILNEISNKGHDMKRFKQAKSYRALINKAIEIQENYHERASYMKVTDITFTKQGTFIVNFEDAEPYVGTWHWENIEERIFGCSFWMPGDENEPVQVQTTGQIGFDKAGRCDIVLDATFSCESKLYDAFVELVCTVDILPRLKRGGFSGG